MGGWHETAPTVMEATCAPRPPTHSCARPRHHDRTGSSQCCKLCRHGSLMGDQLESAGDIWGADRDGWQSETGLGVGSICWDVHATHIWFHLPSRAACTAVPIGGRCEDPVSCCASHSRVQKQGTIMHHNGKHSTYQSAHNLLH